MAKCSSLSPRTFMADLHPMAARFNIKPHLSQVTLANILAGDTCTPISLSDFEKHLTFVEYSVENLQFLVWFQVVTIIYAPDIQTHAPHGSLCQDYRERYCKSSKDSATPSEDNFVFEAPSRAKSEERAEESIANLEKVRTGERAHEDSPQNSTSPNDVASPISATPILPPQYSQLTVPESNDPESNQFRMECLRAVATFLTPCSAKELPLDAIVRDTVIRNLSLGCHPNVFLPVYEEVYSLLERCSLPRFLSAASANINLPKQIYWYAVGALNMLIGILIAILLIIMVPTPPEANRAWRIFPVGFFAVGAAQCYSAWRGYCSQVWMRGTMQLRVWEMQEMDAEAKAFVERILDNYTVSQSASSDSLLEKDPKNAETNIAAIAPFTLQSQTVAGQPSISSVTIPTFSKALVVAAASGPVHNFQRPPVFGPETVVLDPHIKVVHRQVLLEVCRFGLWFLLMFSAIIFPVPSRLH